MMPFSAVRSSNVMVRTWMKQRRNDVGKALGFRLARCGVESGFLCTVLLLTSVCRSCLQTFQKDIPTIAGKRNL